MKKTYLISLLLLLFCTTAGAQSKQTETKEDGAEITFDKKEHNFGVFPEESPVVRCKFTFTNTGNRPLVLVRVRATCGCTVPEYTKAPINPGEKGEIKVTYNGRGKSPGKFAKIITVTSNANTPTTRLVVKGEMLKKQKK